MLNPAPLLIVMGAILALLIVQRVLSRASSPERQNLPAQPESVPARPRGRMLANGLSVTGLDDRAIEQLKELITQDDVTALATFLAFNRPGFLELNEFIEQRRVNVPEKQADTSDAPAGLRLTALNDNEQQKLLSPETSLRLITREFMSRFGGHEFSTYFAHYAARESVTTLHIPPFDPDRKIMESLAKSGIARKGRHIPLAQRLTVLKMSQLRQMAKDLNFDKKFTRKDEATTILADVPGAAVLLSMQYVVDDLFALNPIKEDCEQIKQEWAHLMAYAKLLNTLKLTQ